ncbi:MAG: hypothetical protein AABX71_01695, partial [Nanoarchaeota archaeon]
SLVTRYPPVWIFLILVFGMFIIILLKKGSKGRVFAYPARSKTSIPAKSSIKSFIKGNLGKKKLKEEEIKVAGVQTPGRAEHSLVLKVRKERTGVLALRVKELAGMRKRASETLDTVSGIIKENKGSIFETGDYIIGIFSSPMTKTFENEMLAVKAGREINELLRQHNRKFREKIGYGIALNSGELIVRKDENELRFTSIGNTINLAKKIAELSDSEVLLSEPIQQRVMAQIKADKEVREGVNVYSIKRVVDRDKYREFISDFMNRMKGSK